MRRSTRQAIVFLALDLPLFLSACASPSNPVEIGVSLGPAPTVGPSTPAKSNPIATRSDVMGWDQALYGPI